jgi:hypothetical protein
MRKRVLMIVGAGFLIALLIFSGIVAYRVRRAFSAAGQLKSVPSDLKGAKIVAGAGRFSKEVLFAQGDLGVITDFAQNPNHELVVVGQNGAVFLTDGNSTNRSVTFHRCSSAVVSARLASGSFLCRGAWITNVELFDAAGKTLWPYEGGGSGIDDAAAGTLGPNATESVVVGFNGGGGVRLLNAAGKELWKQDEGNVWHVEIAPATDKSGNVILHSNAKGQLTVRDAVGHVVGRYEPEIYLASFSMTSWGDDPIRSKVIAFDHDSIYVLTTDGKTVVRLPSPGSAAMPNPKGTSVHFSANAPFFAGLLNYPLWDRSLLYIYDNQNQLIYHEILDHNCGALQAIPTKNGTEYLLVGCDGKVLKYSQIAKE